MTPPEVVRRLRNALIVVTCIAAAASCESLLDSKTDDVVVWEHADSRHPTSVPYVDKDIVAYVTQRDGYIVALDAASGNRLWERRLPVPREQHFLPYSATIVAWEDLLIVSAWDVFALDRRSGAVRWSLIGEDDYPGAGRMTLAEGRLFTTGRRLYALDPANGEVLWQSDVDGEQPFSPVVADGRVYLGTRRPLSPSGGGLGAGHAVALNAATGEILWKSSIPDATDSSLLGGATARGVIVDDRFIIASANGLIYAVDRHSGEQIWTYDGRRGYSAGLAVMGDLLIAANNAVEGIDIESGELRWRTEPISTVIADITTSESLAFVSVGRIFAIDRNGAVVWGDGGAGWGGPGYLTPVSVIGRTAYAGAVGTFRALRLPDNIF